MVVSSAHRHSQMACRDTTTGMFIMTHASLSTLLLLVAATAAMPAGAQQSESANAPAVATAPPAAATTPPAQSAPAKPAGPAPDTLKKARNLGMRPKVLKTGQTVYCWKDADTGTRFETEKCVDENNLQATIEQRQALVDQVHRGMSGTNGK